MSIEAPTPPSPVHSASAHWLPGPLHPRLAPGALHVWRDELDAAGSEHLVELLSAEEAARAERILGALARERWKRAHGVLRALLGRYLGCDPRALRFGLEPGGKPILVDHARSRGADEAAGPKRGGASSRVLAFNISHSGPFAVYAVSESGPVGVDVEVAKPRRNKLAVAARALGPVEARRLEDLEPVARGREFLRAWTAYEARLKCAGSGIGGLPQAQLEQMWVAELAVGPRAAVAVAARRAPSDLCCWKWT